MSWWENKMKKYILIGVLCFNMIYAEARKHCKHSLKCNMTHIYEETVPGVNNIEEMFSQGIYYARIRSNSFAFQWQDKMDAVRKDHAIAAIGGSFIYRSAYLHGWNDPKKLDKKKFSNSIIKMSKIIT